MRSLRFRSLDRADASAERGPRVENQDAGQAAREQHDPFPGGSNYPPGYVKPADEGRPRR